MRLHMAISVTRLSIARATGLASSSSFLAALRFLLRAASFPAHKVLVHALFIHYLLVGVFRGLALRLQIDLLAIIPLGLTMNRGPEGEVAPGRAAARMPLSQKCERGNDHPLCLYRTTIWDPFD